MAAPPFRPGQHVLYRGPHVDDSGNTGPPVICDVKPVTVVEDSESLISLYMAAGTSTLMSKGLKPGLPKPWGPGDWELISSRWDRWHTLFLIVPGEWRATWVRWSPSWDFMGWYVNLQEPLWRTRWGFDIRDLQLDIVVAPDGTWHWKDEDEFERSIAFGLFSKRHAKRVRRTANDSLEAISGNKWPFIDSLKDWRPNPEWSVPQLPRGAKLEEMLSWSSEDAIDRC
ncbi:MAG: DUF402 domain-containing protein [Dehalococcoidia bacterium]